MTLNAFAARLRLAILDDLRNGRPPREGSFDAARFAEAKGKRPPQVGATRYEPWAIHQEYIFPDPVGGTLVLTVTFQPPERIVFLSVPAWVTESIWQGEISGSAHFESDATALVDAFVRGLSEGENAAAFLPRPKTGREQS